MSPLQTALHLDRVRALFAAISAGDPDRAAQYLAPTFLQHNPHAADGVDGLRQFIRNAPREALQLTIVRALEDGPFVVTQSKGLRSGKEIFFDICRFDNNLVAEHWAFATADAPPNLSGHTQLDGPTEPTHLADTDRNKALVRDYYQTVHVDGHHDRIPSFFHGDHCIRHEPGVRDGVAAFQHDLARLVQNRTIDEIKLVLGQGDLVFIAARGTADHAPCAYVDLYRVADNKLAERWGFSEPIPTATDSKNQNGML